jgi:hypothetical protein
LAKFKVLEHTAGESFVIPTGDIPTDCDLMYYFEILSDAGGGWFQPDPLTTAPYYVVKTVK